MTEPTSSPAWVPAMVRRRLDPAGRFGLRLTLAAVALLLVAVPFALLLVQVRRSGPLLSVDRGVATTLHSAVRGHETTITALKAITAIGTLYGLGTMTLIGLLIVARARRWRLAAFLLATSLGGWALNNSIKAVVGRERPTFDDPFAHARGLSFPSGHAMNSVVVIGALVVVFLPAARPARRRVICVAAALLALLIGFTRLALGVHYVTDVTAGFILGAAWLTACVAAFSVWRVERGRRPVTPTAGLEPEASSDLRAAGTRSG